MPPASVVLNVSTYDDCPNPFLGVSPMPKTAFSQPNPRFKSGVNLYAACASIKAISSQPFLVYIITLPIKKGKEKEGKSFDE